MPPSRVNAQPAACTLITRLAMLNNVRYGGFFVVIRNVHWLHALMAPTIIVCAGPSRINERKSTAYDTDIVDPLRASGRFTLNADVIEESRSSVTNHSGCENRSSGKSTARSTAPPAITDPTYTRAATGSCFIARSAPCVAKRWPEGTCNPRATKSNLSRDL